MFMALMRGEAMSDFFHCFELISGGLELSGAISTRIPAYPLVNIQKAIENGHL